MYGGLDPEILNTTCNTEESGTTTYIEGNPHDNMATNFSLTAGGEKISFSALRGSGPLQILYIDS